MFNDPKEFQRIGNDLSLLIYHPKSSWGETENNKLILDFKRNDPSAVQWVTDVCIQLFTNNEKKFQNTLRFHYLVSIPSHAAGSANTPCEHVCIALAQRFAWLIHLPHALVRTQTVPKSAWAKSYDERTKCSRHMETIQYEGPTLHVPDETIIMFDDVITCGETSKACRIILKRETDCKRVVGLFVGRRVWHA